MEKKLYLLFVYIAVFAQSQLLSCPTCNITHPPRTQTRMRFPRRDELNRLIPQVTESHDVP